MYKSLHDLHAIARKKISAIFRTITVRSNFNSLLALSLLLPASVCFAGAGGLDPNFASSGLLNLTGKNVGAIASQPDGKFITGRREFVAINTPSNFSLVRYNADGSIDKSFGNGEVTTDFGGGSNSITSIAVQPDGKILAVGYNYISPNGGSVVIARYNNDGTPDNSFDGDGKLSLPNLVIYLPDAPFLAVQPDGKIAIATYEVIMRLNPNGSIDYSFGTSGKVTFQPGVGIVGIVAQTDNKLVVAGSANDNFLVTRFNTDGSPDNTFDGDGTAVTDFGGADKGLSIALQPDGKIVVVGSNDINASGILLARYNTNGSPDNSFDGDGKSLTTTGLINYPTVLLQSDGSIVVAGGGSEFSVARFNANGAPDNSFDNDGFATLGANNQRSFGAVISGNNVLVVGTYYYSGLSVVAGFSLANSTYSGLNYRYFTGDFNALPEFNSLIPTATGLTPNIDITARPAGATDHFAVVWEGYINIQTPGTYSFETISDDGSKFYFNTFYTPSATALISNDGVHAPVPVTASVNIAAAGLYPITITYFEKDGGEAMELYWTKPGGSRQLVPNNVFTPKNAQVDHEPPTIPQNLHTLYAGRTFARVDWQNSTDNAGVAGYRVTYTGGVKFTLQPYIILENLAPGSTNLIEVRAVDSAGNLSFAQNNILFVNTATSGLNYKFYNNVPYGVSGIDRLTPTKAGPTNNIDVSVRTPGVNENYAFVWQGYINIPAPGVYTFETVSDDGSKFYFNTLYSDNAEPLVNNYENNGLHAPLSISKTVNIPSAGLYPVALRYHQYGGGQLVQLYWQGPGIARQLVPDAAFTNDTKPGFLANGLNYKYYEGTWTTLPDFNALTPIQSGQTATVDISKRPAGRNDNFAFVWEGYITLPTGGDYTFETVSDDGSKLYFNSSYVPSAIATVNNDGLHAATSASAKVSVVNGGTYPIAITFFENNGDQKMELYWSGPNFKRELIPAHVFSTVQSNQTSKLISYAYPGTWSMLPDFGSLFPTKTGVSNNLDLNKAKPEGIDDGFGIRWFANIYLPTPGNYTFETVSDDGSKLYFNGNFSPAIVNNDGVHPAQSASGTVFVANAGVHSLVIDYFEQYGGQSMELYWSGPGIPRQKVPDEAFVFMPAFTFPTSFPGPVIMNNETISTAIASQGTSRHSVYPNPFSDNITVDFYNDFSSNNISVGLYDLNGRKVYVTNTGKLPVGNSMIKLNLGGNNIKDGVYFVQIQKNGIIWKTTKVVKMKN